MPLREMTTCSMQKSMKRYKGNQYLYKHPRPGVAYQQCTTDHPHSNKTRRCLIGKICPLSRQLCAVGRCRGEAIPSTSSLHEGRCHRQAKTLLSNHSWNRPGHHSPTTVEGPGNSKREPGRLQNRPEHHGSLQSTSANRHSQIWNHWSCKSLRGYRNK
jgi:hypothetical protein